MLFTDSSGKLSRCPTAPAQINSTKSLTSWHTALEWMASSRSNCSNINTIQWKDKDASHGSEILTRIIKLSYSHKQHSAQCSFMFSIISSALSNWGKVCFFKFFPVESTAGWMAMISLENWDTKSWRRQKLICLISLSVHCTIRYMDMIVCRPQPFPFLHSW